MRFPKDQSGSGPKGATDKPYSQHKACEGGVVDGTGKSTDVCFSFCRLLLSSFLVFNPSEHSLLSQHALWVAYPCPAYLYFIQSLAPPMSLPTAWGSRCTLQPDCAPAPTRKPFNSSHYASGELGNNREGHKLRAVGIPKH